MAAMLAEHHIKANGSSLKQNVAQSKKACQSGGFATIPGDTCSSRGCPCNNHARGSHPYPTLPQTTTTPEPSVYPNMQEKRGGGWWRKGVLKPKNRVPEMAQINFSFYKIIHFFPIQNPGPGRGVQGEGGSLLLRLSAMLIHASLSTCQ